MITTAKVKHYVLPALPYMFIFWFFDKAGEAVRKAPESELLHKLMYGIGNINTTLSNPMPSLNPQDLFVGLIGAAAILGIVKYKQHNAKKWRYDAEYGSARWGNKKDIAPFIDPRPDNNVILTATESLTLNNRPANPKYARNKNVLIVGGSGSGKTRFWLKPNLMQLHSSYIVTDPKGTILTECGQLLRRGTPKTIAVVGKNGRPLKDRHGNVITETVKRNGKTVYEPYEIKVLNTIDFKKSMHYNPFAYIRTEKDILKFTTALIANTKGEDSKSGEDFWVKAETLLYCALIGFIHYEARPEEKNINTLVELINAMEVREEDDRFMNAVDMLFEKLEKGAKIVDGENNPVLDENGNVQWEAPPQPQHFAVRQYKKYKLAAGKTAKSILISCGARLAPFDIAELREIMSYDEMELDTIGDRKTALFIIISDTDTTYNFVTALMYSQLLNLLCDKADTEYEGKLPVPVRFLLDEFANIGKIPNFDKLIATIRSREISACVILQTQSQLKTMYKEAAETIIGNMDSRLFLGGSEKTTLKDLSESLGKETIYLLNHSESKGNNPSYSKNQQKLGKELMSIDELAVMDGSKCILQLRGVRPFLSDKYDITKHKNYRYLSDASKRNAFDIGKYVSTRLKVNPNEDYTIHEYTPPDEDMPDTAFGDFQPSSSDAGNAEDDTDFPEDLEPI